MKNLSGFFAKFLSAVLVSAGAGLFEYKMSDGQYTVMRTVCDGTFFSAVLFTGIGLLMLTGRQGVFDGLRYIGYLIFNVLTRFRERKTYPEYTKSLRQAQKNPAPLQMILNGMIMLAVSVIMLMFSE